LPERRPVLLEPQLQLTPPLPPALLPPLLLLLLLPSSVWLERFSNNLTVHAMTRLPAIGLRVAVVCFVTILAKAATTCSDLKYTDLVNDEGGNSVLALASHDISCANTNGFIRGLQLGDGSSTGMFWYKYYCCTAEEAASAVCTDQQTTYIHASPYDVTVLMNQQPSCSGATEFMSKLKLEEDSSQIRYNFKCCSLPGSTATCETLKTAATENDHSVHSVRSLFSHDITCNSDTFLKSLQLNSWTDGGTGLDMLDYEYTCCSFTSSPAPSATPTSAPTAAPTDSPTVPTGAPTGAPTADMLNPPTAAPTVVAGMLSADEAKVLGTTVTSTVCISVAAALATTFAASSAAHAGFQHENDLVESARANTGRAAMQLVSQIQMLASLSLMRAVEDESPSFSALASSFTAFNLQAPVPWYDAQSRTVANTYDDARPSCRSEAEAKKSDERTVAKLWGHVFYLVLLLIGFTAVACGVTQLLASKEQQARAVVSGSEKQAANAAAARAAAAVYPYPQLLLLSLMLQGSWVVTMGALAAAARQQMWVEWIFALIWLLLYPIGFSAFTIRLVTTDLPSNQGARYDSVKREWCNAKKGIDSSFVQKFGIIFADYKGTRAARLFVSETVVQQAMLGIWIGALGKHPVTQAVLVMVTLIVGLGLFLAHPKLGFDGMPLAHSCTVIMRRDNLARVVSAALCVGVVSSTIAGVRDIDCANQRPVEAAAQNGILSCAALTLGLSLGVLFMDLVLSMLAAIIHCIHSARSAGAAAASGSNKGSFAYCVGICKLVDSRATGSRANVETAIPQIRTLIHNMHPNTQCKHDLGLSKSKRW
jgi:hypothetical protein